MQSSFQFNSHRNHFLFNPQNHSFIHRNVTNIGIHKDRLHQTLIFDTNTYSHFLSFYILDEFSKTTSYFVAFPYLEDNISVATCYRGSRPLISSVRKPSSTHIKRITNLAASELSTSTTKGRILISIAK